MLVLQCKIQIRRDHTLLLHFTLKHCIYGPNHHGDRMRRLIPMKVWYLDEKLIWNLGEKLCTFMYTKRHKNCGKVFSLPGRKHLFCCPKTHPLYCPTPMRVLLNTSSSNHLTKIPSPIEHEDVQAAISPVLSAPCRLFHPPVCLFKTHTVFTTLC